MSDERERWLRLEGHKCRPIAEARSRSNDDGRAFWIGELLKPIEGFPNEKWCVHITTPKKGEIVFGFEDGDFEQWAVMTYIAIGHVNPNWVERVARVYKAWAKGESDE